MFNNYFIFLILPFSVFLFSSVTSRFYDKFNSVKTEHNLNIDGLRGLLAITVFFYHFILLYNWIDTGVWGGIPLNPVNNLGSIPVSLFFMITGYLFFGKIFSNPEVNWINLYISRVMRIYPVYLVGVFFVFLFYFILSHNAPTMHVITSLVRWLLFQGYNIGDFDAKRVVAGVQWTLVYEAIFYASLPICFMIYWKKYNVRAIIISLISLSAVVVYSMSYPVEYGKLFIFAFGLIPHIVNKRKIVTRFSTSFLASMLSITFISMALFWTTQYSITQEILIGSVFVVVCCGNSLLSVLTKKTVCMLGQLSYCIYILHGIFLFVIFKIISTFGDNSISYYWFMVLFPVIYIFVVMLSILIHRKIEMKGMLVGKAIISKNITQR